MSNVLRDRHRRAADLRAPSSALGVGESRPRLSWRTSAPAGWTQAAYELRVDDHTYERVTSPDRSWCPGRGSSCAPGNAPRYASASPARTARSPRGARSAEVETGLLRPEDWAARPVGAPWAEDPDPTTGAAAAGAPRVRGARRAGARARLYATAHGALRGRDQRAAGRRRHHVARLDVYPHRLRYYTYDVTPLLAPAPTRSAPGSATAGTAAGSAGAAAFRNMYGTDLSLIAQLEMTYADGAATRRHRRRRGGPRPGRSCAPATTTARAYDARLRAARLVSRRGSTTPAGSRWRSAARPGDARRADGSAGAVHRGGRAGRGAPTPAAPTRARLRPEPRRPPADPRVAAPAGRP